MGDGILALRVNSHSHNQGHQQLCTYIIMLLYFRKNQLWTYSLKDLGLLIFIFSLTVPLSAYLLLFYLTTLVLTVLHYSIIKDRYEAYWIKRKEKGDSLVVGWLGLCLPMLGVQVQFLVKELGSYMPHSHKTKTWSRSNIGRNSIKTKKKTEMSNSNICDGICGFNARLLLSEILLDPSFGYEFHKKSLKYRYLWLA